MSRGPWHLSSRIRNDGSIAAWRLGRRRVTRIRHGSIADKRQGRRRRGPSPARDNEGGRLPEAERRGVEGVLVIENKRNIKKVGVFVVVAYVAGVVV